MLLRAGGLPWVLFPPSLPSPSLSHSPPLLSRSAVEVDEIRRLSRSFRKLDLNQNGSLSVDEFMSIPELQQNPLVKRVIDILDTDRNGEVDFQGWCVKGGGREGGEERNILPTAWW